jgi:hypothetical protein
MSRGGAVYGPGVEGGARQATPEELAEIRARHEDDESQGERGYASGDIDPEALRQAVQDLMLGRETKWRGGSDTLTARLVTFWRGDAVLDIRVTGPGIASSDLTRVTRQRCAADDEVFAEFLRHALTTS